MMKTKLYIKITAFVLLFAIVSTVFSLVVCASQSVFSEIIVNDNEIMMTYDPTLPLGTVSSDVMAFYGSIMGGGVSGHSYKNVSSPYLPFDGSTYTSYRMSGIERIVISSSGYAYYSPDHYQTWYRFV